MFSQILEKIFVILIKIYQIVLSPYFPRSCRFFPSCSEYTLAAIRRHGPYKGIYYSLVRLSRCHPFHSGGYDPVK